MDQQVTLVAYENLKLAFPFPDPETSITDLVLPQQEDLSRVRARNALKGPSAFSTYLSTLADPLRP